MKKGLDVSGQTSTRYLLALFVVLVIIVIIWLFQPDRVEVRNSAGEEIGLLVDGQWLAGPRNDEPFRSAQTTVEVGRVQRWTTRNEVVAFTARRPVEIVEPVGWTFGPDRVDVPLRGEALVKVTVWIVADPYSEQPGKASDDRDRTQAIWTLERTGLWLAGFGNADYEVVMSTSVTQEFDNFSGCDLMEKLQCAIGRRQRRINVYYVHQVEGSASRGIACDYDLAALGAAASTDLLSHELGHVFALQHVDDSPDEFGTTNVMHSASTVRAFLAEGQLFRAHMTEDSALIAVFHVRSTGRWCHHYDDSPACPKVSVRLWPDTFTVLNQP